MRFGVALICVLVVASGCGPSADDRRYEASQKLMKAWQGGNRPSPGYIQDLLDEGASVGVRTNWGDTPLHQAACALSENPSIEVIQLLLENGAPVNARNDKNQTPLHHHLRKFPYRDTGYFEIEIVQLLIDNGADVNARMADGGTPLMWAAKHTTPEIVQLLIDNGADVRAKTVDGWSPFRCAEMNKHKYRIQQIISDAGRKSRK